MNDWLPSRTIYLVQHGSRAYGTFTETSDYDYRGVVIPPKEYFLGFSKFEQTEYKGDHEETVIYEFRKFVNLAAEANPNMIELLFIDPSHFIKCTSIAEELLEHRQEFLSKKIKFTFSGYAIAQLKRIETHRKWLLTPPQSPPHT
jgi:predicted nucleotidyltransferase